MAFSTASSNATLPTSLKVAGRAVEPAPRIARFVLTIGATANQNGTAMFEGVTVLFLAQFFGIDLRLGQQLMVMLVHPRRDRHGRSSGRLAAGHCADPRHGRRPAGGDRAGAWRRPLPRHVPDHAQRDW